MGKPWHEIVICDGTFEQGDIGFQVNVTVPETSGSRLSATQRQIDAVRHFFQTEIPELDDEQAHILLSCREFGRLCAEAIFAKYPVRIKALLAPCLAAFLTADEELRSFVVTWSDNNFARGTGSPRVRGAPIFADVAAFASYLEGSMEMNGWTRELLKLRFG